MPVSTLTTAAHQLEDLKADAKAAVVRAKPWAAHLIRLGYAAKGGVYCLIGALAAMAAFGASGGRTTGSRGAMKMIAEEPLGRVVLSVVLIGLAAYALWQFFRTAFDPEHDANDYHPKALGRRIVYLSSGCIHAGLVVAAAQLLIGYGAFHDDNAQARDWTARLMGYPAGRWLVAAVGAGFAGGGLWQLIKGLRADLDKQLALERMGAGWHRVTIWVGRVGIAARGVVFNVVGGLLMLAAYHENPNEAKGLSGALAALQRQPYGLALLAGVAVGLFAYGVYLFIRARYRRIELR
jgi:hypothetical protein